jgi:pre-mRNA-splicing helicase BRR2
LVCAPTGAGKTNIAMLAMLQTMALHRTSEGLDLSTFKIVYVAPMKALVQEICLNFGERLKRFGMKVAELTGDVQMSKAQIAETNVIITTPEKWDIVTRKSGHRAFTGLVKLVIIDEVPSPAFWGTPILSGTSDASGRSICCTTTAAPCWSRSSPAHCARYCQRQIKC